MTWGGRLAGLFPTFYLVMNLLALIAFAREPSFFSIGILLSLIYILPLVLFRLHEKFFPLREGSYDLSLRKYNPWWTAHMLQYPFIALPMLESLLQFVPGLYSNWLRAWGSRIGKNVLWTARIEVIDRSLIEVDDNTIVGFMVLMASHVVEQRTGFPNLIIKKVRIGKRCLVGVDSQLGPGSTVLDGMTLKAKTRLFWKGKFDS